MGLKIMLAFREFIPSDIVYQPKENVLVLKLDEISPDILDLKELDISIYLGEKLYTEFQYNVSSIVFEHTVLKIHLNGKLPKFIYDQDVIDVYRSWEANSNLSFYTLPVRKKKAWLFNCFILSGLPAQISRSSVHIDCKNIKDDYDLFFAFAEAFIGPKGYFGRDFNGFRDCLYLCGKSDTSIHLKNAHQLDRIFAKDPSFTKQDFLNDFLKLGYALVEE